MQPRIDDPGTQSVRSSAARTSREDVLAWMREHLARVLGVEPHDLDPRENFLDLGVDSVQAMALLEALAEELQITLPPEVFFEFPTLVDLANHLLATYPDHLARRLRVVQAEPVRMTLSGSTIEPQPDFVSHASSTPTAVRATDVAIIGIAGRFPGASTLDRFWANLRDGVDSISEVPADRWDLEAFYDPDPRAPNKTYLRYGGFLDDIYQFAPLFFHLSPREAAFLDPQQRLFLEIAWETIENAGYAGTSLRGTRTGVYVGVSSGEFLQAMIERKCEMVSYVGTGNSPSIIPNRVSYHLNLRGPSIALDTACSSSLVAIHLACQSLSRGETDYALAGAVALSLHHGKYIYFSKAGMLAPDGRCKTFDSHADGYVPGEGVAAVLLKPLATALRDRDTIHGIIRGVGVNQDGRTNGITAPSPRAQRELCQEVYEKFDIDPSTITYVEAHGTGTPLGDPIEVSAVAQAFGQFTDRKQFCGIGSLKTNVGHLEPVAGVAGLAKVLLAFRNRQLPPTIHFDEVNPHIHFEETPFYLVDRLQEWHSDGPRRATISAFSFGGVNAHLVVEEPPTPLQDSATALARGPHLVTLAAMTDTALASMAARLDEHLAKEPGLSLADVVFTLNVGREQFDRRLAFVVDSLEELRRELVAAADQLESAGRATDGQKRRRKSRQPAFVFVGKPAEALNAALALAKAYPESRALLDGAEALVGTLSPGATLYVFQVALARLWQSWGVVPGAVAGSGAHTLAAAAISGAITFDDGLRQAVGDDSAVGPLDASGDSAIPLLPLEKLSVDEYLHVPIGPADAGERRLAELAAEAYLAGLDLDWQSWHRHGTAGRVALPTYPFERLYVGPPPGRADGAEGPADGSGPVETAAIEPLRRSDPSAVRVEYLDRTPETARGNVTLEDRDGRVLLRLTDVTLKGDFPLAAPAASGDCHGGPIGPDPLLEGVFHQVRWQPRPLAGAGQALTGTYVLFADGVFGEELRRRIVGSGSRVIRVLPGPEYAEEASDVFRVNPRSPGDYVGLVAALQDQGIEPSFIHLWSCGEWEDVLGDSDLLESSLARGVYSLVSLVQAIGKRRLGGPPSLWVGSTDGQPVGSGPIRAERATIHGLMRTLSQEYPRLRCVHVDMAGDEQPETLAADFLAEVMGGGPDRSVAYRNGQRMVPELLPLEAVPGQSPIALRERGVYWITGGLGGVGRLVARYLAERVRARLVLSGRTVPPPRERWDDVLATANDDDPVARVIKDMREIEAAGSEVLILEADVAETWQMRRAARQALERFGAIHGVFQAAGILRDGLIRGKDLSTFREVFRPKIRGSLCLERVLEDHPLDFFVLFSSLTAVLGNIGQSDYSAANAFMDALAWHRNQTLGRSYISLNWSLWESGGMGAGLQQAVRARGIIPLETATATRALEASLTLGLPQVVVGRFAERADGNAALQSPARPAARVATEPTPLPAVPVPTPAPIQPAPVELAPPPEAAMLTDPQFESQRVASTRGASPKTAAGTDQSALREFAEDWLLGLIGPRLGVAVNEIDPETPFLDLGIDSIIAGEIALDAEGQLPVTFSPTMLLDYPTISELAEHLCENYEDEVRHLRDRLGHGSVESAATVISASADEEEVGRRPGHPSDSADVAQEPAVVDSAPIALRQSDRRDAVDGARQILALSAASDHGLEQLAERFRELAARADCPPMDQLCGGVERGELPHRLAVVASSHEELARKLATRSECYRGVVRGSTAPRVAFLFTGQGAQYPGMAELLYRAQPIFRRHMDRCDEISRPHLEQSLLDLLYPSDGRPRPLDQTAFTQPITFAVDYCLAQLWRGLGVEPAAVIGHSVGEYAAACVAGVLSLEDALSLVARRARLMQDLPPGGGMIAVRADETVARSHLREAPGVSVAAINSPSNVVLSGEERWLERVLASLKQAGITAVRLNVSHAFHSTLMEPMLGDFEACFRSVTLRVPRIPLISNLTGEQIGAEIVEPEYWLRQLRQPVRFASGIRRLANDGISEFLEVGPGSTLAGLSREVLGAPASASGPDSAGPLIVSSLARGQEDLDVLLSSLARLWVRGVSVKWGALGAGGEMSEDRDGPARPDAATGGPEWISPWDDPDNGAHLQRVLEGLRRARQSASTQ